VVRVLDYTSRGPGSIPGVIDFLSSSGSGTGSTQPREYNLEAVPVWKAENTAIGIRYDDLAWVGERTIQTERPPLVGEVCAKFCG
jgi:hypothetical protein